RRDAQSVDRALAGRACGHPRAAASRPLRHARYRSRALPAVHARRVANAHDVCRVRGLADVRLQPRLSAGVVAQRTCAETADILARAAQDVCRRAADVSSRRSNLALDRHQRDRDRRQTKKGMRSVTALTNKTGPAFWIGAALVVVMFTLPLFVGLNEPELAN